jgi:hypothetical protein
MGRGRALGGFWKGRGLVLGWGFGRGRVLELGVGRGKVWG